jgi:hypothetical protein
MGFIGMTKGILHLLLPSFYHLIASLTSPLFYLTFSFFNILFHCSWDSFAPFDLNCLTSFFNSQEACYGCKLLLGLDVIQVFGKQAF